MNNTSHTIDLTNNNSYTITSGSYVTINDINKTISDLDNISISSNFGPKKDNSFCEILIQKGTTVHVYNKSDSMKHVQILSRDVRFNPIDEEEISSDGHIRFTLHDTGDWVWMEVGEGDVYDVYIEPRVLKQPVTYHKSYTYDGTTITPYDP